MGNTNISGSDFNVLRGTINATGTLSGELDFGPYTLPGGLVFTNATNGTLNFQISAYPDANTNTGYTSNYATVVDDTGTAVAITLPSGSSCISPEKLRFLAGARYVKIKTTPAQTTGCALLMPVRA